MQFCVVPEFSLLVSTHGAILPVSGLIATRPGELRGILFTTEVAVDSAVAALVMVGPDITVVVHLHLAGMIYTVAHVAFRGLVGFFVVLDCFARYSGLSDCCSRPLLVCMARWLKDVE